MNKKSKKLGWVLLGGASLAAMITPAFAQETPEVSDEIVVTATGRAAAIQDVPIAVQAIPNETLEQAGVRSLLDLRQLAPSMRIGSGQSQTSGTAISIRGIGTGSDNPGFEAAVGVFIDGVYRARTGAALSDLPDIERVEILRGPQGTLYGKNTSAGAISVITAAPDFEQGAWLEGTSRSREIAVDRIAFLDKWLRARPHLAPRFARAERVTPVIATGPFASHTRRAWVPGAALVGDAADFFDPFTGEGIYAALRGGELLGVAVRDALAAPTARESDRALAEYDAARRREFRGKWIVERAIGAIVGTAPLINRAARSLAKRKDLADLLIGVTGNFIPPREVIRLGYLWSVFGWR